MGRAKRIKAAGLGNTWTSYRHRGGARGEGTHRGCEQRGWGGTPHLSHPLPGQPGPGKAPREQVDSLNWTVANTSAESGHNRFHQIPLRMVTPQHQGIYDEGHPRSKAQAWGGSSPESNLSRSFPVPKAWDTVGTQ